MLNNLKPVSPVSHKDLPSEAPTITLLIMPITVARYIKMNSDYLSQPKSCYVTVSILY